MTPADWKQFWNSYRRGEVANEGDLFVEVGRTVNRAPISRAIFQLAVTTVEKLLALEPADRLLELCCGNGLLTQQLAPKVQRVHAVDFGGHLIEHAKRFHSANNVTYICAEACSYLQELSTTRDFSPNKILLGDALAYFEPATFREILRSVDRLTDGKFLFLATGVPCDERKWNFYDTPERIKRYEKNRLLPHNTNDGIGRWWGKREIEKIAEELQLEVIFHPQPPEISNFRVDVCLQSPCEIG